MNECGDGMFDKKNSDEATAHAPVEIPCVLTEEQLETFRREGVLVLPGILSPHEVELAMSSLARTLLRYNVDVSDLPGTGHNLRRLSSTNGSGGVLDLFYPDWKMEVALNEKLWAATVELWHSCYCHRGEKIVDLQEADRWKWHPHGAFDCTKGFAFLDRIGYRLPTAMAAEIGKNHPVDIDDVPSKARNISRHRTRPIQRSLTPHLDCCPDTFDCPEGKTKWRPIQCFVSLTDNTLRSTGGFEAAPGFHRRFHLWAKNRNPTVVKKKINGKFHEVSRHSAPCIGNYTHIRPAEDRDVISQVRHIPIKAGDAVFWDERIPHANSYKHDGENPRAVVYCSFLPDIELNRSFVRQQLEDWIAKKRPTDQWIEISDKEDDEWSGKSNSIENIGDSSYTFTTLGRKLMGIEDW